MAKPEFEVLEVLGGNRAIVSTEGKCRVVIMPSGDIHEELVDLETAHMLCHDAELLKNRGSRCWFEAIDYATGEVLQFDNRGLSESWMKRHRQVMGALHVGEKRWPKRPLIRTPMRDRVRGFRLGRLATAAKVVPFKAERQKRAKYRSA